MTRLYTKLFFTLLFCAPYINAEQAEELTRHSLETVTLAPEHMQNMMAGNSDEKYLYLFYVSADNDLRNFAVRVVRELAKVGSNENVTILVHLDIRTAKNLKVTRRYLVEKDNIVCLNLDDPATQCMNSGDPNTLIDFVRWGTQNFPHTKIALAMWDHGTGYLNPIRHRAINSSELFTFNPATNMIELDRSIGYLDYIELQDNEDYLGICWDDSHHQFLDNKKLAYALNTICNECLGGNKLNLLALDGCLMQQLEIADLVAPYADILIGSQEVILAIGPNYDRELSIFRHGCPTPKQLSKHLVQAFKESFINITPDFTESAITLEHIPALSNNLGQVGGLFIEALNKQKFNSVRNALAHCRSKKMCTCFEEPTYIDLGHFYHNVLHSLHQFKLMDANRENGLRQELAQLLEEGIALIDELVIAKCAGRNVKRSTGLSIYFPASYLHPSYKRDLPFKPGNKWPAFLKRFLQR